MKSTAYIMALILFVLCLAGDVFAFVTNQPLAGIALTTSTLITFFAAHAWFIHHPEPKLKISAAFLIVPLGVIDYGVSKILFMTDVSASISQEKLLTQGQVIMSKFQGALWILGFLMIGAFVLAASLLQRRDI